MLWFACWYEPVLHDRKWPMMGRKRPLFDQSVTSGAKLTGVQRGQHSKNMERLPLCKRLLSKPKVTDVDRTGCYSFQGRKIDDAKGYFEK